MNQKRQPRVPKKKTSRTEDDRKYPKGKEHTPVCVKKVHTQTIVSSKVNNT